MKFVFASDSFKGSLTSKECGKLLTEAAKKVFRNCDCVVLPVADGGEGLVEAVVDARGGKIKKAEVSGPHMEPIKAEYGELDQDTAILEMASASGLTLVEEPFRNPEKTTSYGTGELIMAALDAGYTNIAIGVGGSATNDGGMGCLRAMGVKFLDENGKTLYGRGEDLAKVRYIDDSRLYPLARKATFTIMTDVDNHLTGLDGATYVFGAQKGGDFSILERLEKGMVNYKEVIKKQKGIDPDDFAGGGAGGGLAAGLAVFLGGHIRSGSQTVLDLIRFDEAVKGASLVVTGEGRIDTQSIHGKVISAIGARCREKGIPCAALAGQLGEEWQAMYDRGLSGIATILDKPMTENEAIENAKKLYASGAERFFRLIQTGMAVAELEKG